MDYVFSSGFAGNMQSNYFVDTDVYSKTNTAMMFGTVLNAAAHPRSYQVYRLHIKLPACVLHEGLSVSFAMFIWLYRRVVRVSCWMVVCVSHSLYRATATVNYVSRAGWINAQG